MKLEKMKQSFPFLPEKSCINTHGPYWFAFGKLPVSISKQVSQGEEKLFQAFQQIMSPLPDRSSYKCALFFSQMIMQSTKLPLLPTEGDMCSLEHWPMKQNNCYFLPKYYLVNQCFWGTRPFISVPESHIRRF